MKKAVLSAFALTAVIACLFGCAKIEFNAVILKDGYSLSSAWLDSRTELIEDETYVITDSDALEEIFTDFEEIDFEKRMVVVYCYTTIFIREQKLERVSLDDGVLSIEFDVVKGKLGTADATAPQTRVCVICLDNVALTDVKVKYNGQ